MHLDFISKNRIEKHKNKGCKKKLLPQSKWRRRRGGGEDGEREEKWGAWDEEEEGGLLWEQQTGVLEPSVQWTEAKRYLGWVHALPWKSNLFSFF